MSQKEEDAEQESSDQRQPSVAPHVHSSVSQLREQGNQCFRDQQFQKAFDLYTSAIDLCPESCVTDRSVLLSNRAAARAHIHADDWDGIVDDCTRSLDLDPGYIKPLRRRALVYRQMGNEKLDTALADYQRLLHADPTDSAVQRSIAELESEISERNEKMRTEMLSKLKDLGNAVLKPFGLSTNNFHLDPNDAGGYSVNFKGSGGDASQT